jgi:hypothetical protein
MADAFHPEFAAHARDHVMRRVIGRFIYEEDAVEFLFGANHAVNRSFNRPPTEKKRSKSSAGHGVTALVMAILGKGTRQAIKVLWPHARLRET